ncbi:Crp/Fnr family transcriptional regulator [Paenibacillus sacheonensis]|uniref:Helix-turn-helix domain-containing protein n=1 Tax=Paenibacillus sacheonensis TaxID=742054 RepID=A0A7X4YJQ3_9BACL|nr:Crp/Fnr family transcriptional regulator [Paenibacillus sacheonensis]MBM7563987.1 CRP/FNR family transcriptional regulator [Paenibacillus sacheonensis]NBC67673.1 helix-turn-helix domain-containing protein [Paenibacillus sacheonensis]
MEKYQIDKLWYLSKISIFEEMTSEEMKEIDLLNTIRHFNWVPKDVLVQSPDTVLEGLSFVKEGKLKVYKLNDSGKQFTLSILTHGNMFGEINSLSLGTKEVYVEALEPTLVCSISEAQFDRLMISRPSLALKLLKVVSERLKEREEQLEQIAFNGLRERVIHMLTMLSSKFGTIVDGYALIDLPLTHQEIANMLGVTREAVSGVMSGLVKDGVIKTSRKSIQVNAAILNRPQ